MSATVMPLLIQSLTCKAGIGLPSRAVWAARCSGLLSQVQLSGNSLAVAVNRPEASKPRELKSAFAFILLGSNTGRADWQPGIAASNVQKNRTISQNKAAYNSPLKARSRKAGFLSASNGARIKGE